MTIRTVEQYLQSLRDNRVVYCKGERVKDVTTHPIVKHGLRGPVGDFTVSLDPRYKDLITTKDDKGEPISFYFKPPLNVDDLMRRREITQTVMRMNGGGAKFAGIDALHAVTAASRRMDADMGTSYAKRVEAFRDLCFKTDPAVCNAMTDVKGDRSLRPSKQQQHKDYYVRIVDETKNGIVVRGAKAHISVAPYSNEMLVLPGRNMTEDDKDYAVAFAIPPNTKGISMIMPSPELIEEGGFLEHPFYSWFLANDCIVIFDDVFVPNERVFMKREYLYAGAFTYMFANFHRLTADSYKPIECETLVGAAYLMAEYNGLLKASHIIEKLAWLMWYAETITGLGLASVQNCIYDKVAQMAYPNPMFSNAAKFFFADNYHQALKHVQDIGGGILVTCPSSEDFLSPQTHDFLEKYLGGKAGIPTENRIKIIKLIRDLSGPFHMVTTIHAEGSLLAQKNSFYALGEWERYKTAAKKYAGIPMEEEEMHPSYRGLPDYRHLEI